MSYLFTLFIYLFIFIHLFIIFRRPPSAVCFLLLQTPDNGLATGALFFFSSPRLPLRRKCHVRLAWFIKRLLCISQFHLRPAPPPPCPLATAGHFPALSVPGVGHLQILHLPGAWHLPTPRPFTSF